MAFLFNAEFVYLSFSGDKGKWKKVLFLWLYEMCCDMNGGGLFYGVSLIICWNGNFLIREFKGNNH